MLLRPFLASTIVLSAVATPALAQGNLVFEPVADAAVRLDDSGGNFGTEDTLRLDYSDISARNHFKRTYLRFDVQGIDGLDLDCVTLHLHEGSGTAGNIGFEVRKIGGTWSETGITWDNQPGTSGQRVGVWAGGQLVDGQDLYIALDPNTFRNGDGIYNFVLAETDDGGTSETRFDSREDNNPPELIFGCDSVPTHAGFTASVLEGVAPLTTRFTDQSTASATSWSWDFGDGSTSNLKSPQHTYTTPGRYSVELTVTGPEGTAVGQRPGYVFAYPPDGDVVVKSWSKVSQIAAGGNLPLDDSDMFGRAVARIGDVDGNGVDDLVVGAVGDDDSTSGEDKAGAVWILFMRADFTVLGTQKISELFGGLGDVLDSNDGFGRVAAGIGDLDLDGVPDIAVGANYDDDGGSNSGAVYILFLNADGTVKAQQKISDSAGGLSADIDSGDQFGRGIACLGDYDGDGVQDLAVGATNDDDGNGDAGACYILFMNRDGTVKDYSKISDTSGGLSYDLKGGDWFGMSLATLGDVDGDGVQDLAVAAMLDNDLPSDTGAVYVLLMNADGTVKSDFKIDAVGNGVMAGEIQSNDEFGGATGGPGDVDGDGIPDLAVGSIRDDDTHKYDQFVTDDRGAVYLFFLNADGTVKGYQKLSDTRGAFDGRVDLHDRIGESLGAAGDWDGDGVMDLLVGSRFDDDGGPNHGAVYLFELSNGLSTPPPVAGFSAEPTSGATPLTVFFSDESSVDTTAWSWDFGDGETAAVQSPTHTYTAPGSYAVELTVSGAGGTDALLQPGYVTVSAPPAPVADFSADPTAGTAPLAVAFTDLSTGAVSSWSWDFGDGAGSSEAAPLHTYTVAGTFSVSLTVAGAGGSDQLLLADHVTVAAPAPVVAVFDGFPTSGVAPLAVDFTDLSTGGATSWAWDFGDGGASSAQDPSHTYDAPGTYTVSLTASNSVSSDVAAKTDYVVATPPPPPVAAFAADQLSGAAPLTVRFSDLSTGGATGWSWDFGDGGASAAQNPTHVYLAEGTYSVALTVSGAGGSGATSQADLIQVLAPVGGIDDGSFENQTRGALPTAPWTVDFGGAHVVNPVGPAVDGGMPSTGSQWLEISAAGTFDAIPPSSPGGVTLPPVGGAGVSQVFTYDEAEPVLKFGAAFLLDGPAASASLNDWMSVDVSDGVTTVNLFYADTFDAFDATSSKHGLPMTSATGVSADLSTLFPASTSSTIFTLTVQVGNGGDDQGDSRGYVDAIRLEADDSPAFEYYGCGVNPAGSLVLLEGQPVIGTQMKIGLDNPLGTQNPGTTTVLMLTSSPDPAYPCGGLFVGLSLLGPDDLGRAPGRHRRLDRQRLGHGLAGAREPLGGDHQHPEQHEPDRRRGLRAGHPHRPGADERGVRSDGGGRDPAGSRVTPGVSRGCTPPRPTAPTVARGR